MNESIPIENKSIVPEGDLTPKDYDKWLARLRFALNFHKRDLVPKYRKAKKRYNSEIGYMRTIRQAVKTEDLNLLFKSVRNFIGSIFFQNPEVDFSSRSDDFQEKRRIENLEQAVNDDIKDNREFKKIVRSALVDESLAGLGALYVDYVFDSVDAIGPDGRPIPISTHQEPVIDPMTGQPVLDEMGQPMTQEVPDTDEDGNPMYQQDILKNEVCVFKIRPENLIRPPYQQFYEYKSSPYLGYVDIVTIDKLKEDKSLNPEVIAKLKGKEYRSLLEANLYDLKDNSSEADQTDINYVRVFYVFIKDKGGLKRLVIADEEEVNKTPLYYGEWDKGHESYPVHILALNEPSDSFIPPSEAWILESILTVIDYVYKKMVKHARKSATRQYIKTGVGGLSKDEFDKIVKNIDQDLIGVANLPTTTPLSSIVHQVQDAPLSAEHSSIFSLAKQIFDELSRQPSFSKAQTINTKKTATESQAIQQADNTTNGDYIDKFKDFLIDIFIDFAKLKQRNFQGTKQIKVDSKETGQVETREITKDDMQGDFNCDVDVQSFMPPNKEIKRMTVKATLGDLTTMAEPLKQSGYQLNVKKLVESYAENVEIRNSEDLLMPFPLRDIDQQLNEYIYKGVPLNPDQLGDKQEALNRLVSIFEDDFMMNTFEQVKPGISQQNGELVQFILALQNFLKQNQGTQAPPQSQAQTDLGANTAQMALAQR